jgi:hypothetical protein
MTLAILEDVINTCRPFFKQIAAAPAYQLLGVGVLWVKALCRSLAKYLPETEAKKLDETKAEAPSELTNLIRQWIGRRDLFRFSNEAEQSPQTDEVAPLNGPHPPALFDPPSAAEQIARSLLDPKSKPESRLPSPLQSAALKEVTQRALASFSAVLDLAGGQQNEWEDLRSDLLEHLLQSASFSPSPIEGNPVEGHEVSVKLGNEDAASEEIFDRPIELSDDLTAYEELLAESQPIIAALQRTLYPNVEEAPETERFRTSGSLDPARLAMAEISPAVFRRYRIYERADRRGRPVLLIACDGSASLSQQQMQMTKVLAAAWLASTVKSDIQILAGLYHSGAIRPGLSGPLVEWMHHPRKTPATHRADAARALVSLPGAGTGVQSDVLSLAFMLEEARRVARGKMVYLILISDCAWNRSFKTEKDGREEVYSFFETIRQDHPGKLHTTLVALGVNGATGFEELLDKVIAVSGEQLTDYTAVARQIGLYVASCMSDRHSLMARR